MEIGTLELLLLLYAGILLVNTGLAVVLWIRNRTPLYRALVLFWGAYSVGLVVQGAVAAGDDLAICLGFAALYLCTLTLGQLFAVALKARFPAGIYTSIHLVCIGLTTVLFAAGARFEVMAMPVCIGNCGPLVHILVVYRRRWRDLTIAGKGLMLTCLVYSAHTLDFAFLRKVDWFAPVGFTIAVGLVITQSMFAFAAVLETAEAAARSRIEATAEELALANQRLKERHRELEAAVERNVALTSDARRAAGRALAASEAKSAFLARMSHELRTPLNAVIGYADLLAEEELVAADGLDDLWRIRRSARNLLGMVDEILELVRLESGREELDLEEVDLAELIDDVIEALGPAAERRHDVVEAEVALDRPVPLDRARVRQLLVNLVGNAVKFTEHGQVRIRATEEGGRLTIEVRDTGIGIPADRVSHVFEPFEQANRDIALTYGGTGLGLTLSDRIVRWMGGEISVETTLGRGSTFTVCLPLDRPGPRQVRGELVASSA